MEKCIKNVPLARLHQYTGEKVGSISAPLSGRARARFPKQRQVIEPREKVTFVDPRFPSLLNVVSFSSDHPRYHLFGRLLI